MIGNDLSNLGYPMAINNEHFFFLTLSMNKPFKKGPNMIKFEKFNWKTNSLILAYKWMCIIHELLGEKILIIIENV